MCATAGSHANAVRGPLNALFFTVFDGYLNRLLSNRKSQLFTDLPDEVVEPRRRCRCKLPLS